MSDQEQLLISIGVRQNQIEREMRKISQSVGGNLDKVERRAKQTGARLEQTFATASTRIVGQLKGIGGAFAGGFAGGMFAGGLQGFVRAARGVVSELSEMGKQIDRVGLGAKTFQELQFGFNLAGVEAATFSRGMETFNQKIGEAATKGNELTKIFKANGVALRDQAGNVRSNEDLLRAYANLIKNAGSEQEQMTLATRAFGEDAGRKFVLALRNGSDGLDDMAKAADDAGGVIDEKLIRKAEQLDDKWAATWRNFEINAKSAVMSAIGWIDDLEKRGDELANAGFFRKLAEILPSWGGADLTYLDPDLARAKGQAPGPDARVRDAFRDGAGAALTDADAALIAELQKRYGVAAKKTVATIIPGGDNDDRKPGGRNRAADAALREAEAVEKLIDALQFELSLVGKSDLEKRQANAVRQAGAAATDDQRAAITALIAAIEAEEAAQESATEAKREFASMASGALSDFAQDLLSGASAGDAFAGMIRRLTAQLVDMALQAMILKPLMAMFGFSTGGFVTARATPGYATGGYVRGPGTATSDSIPARLSDGEYVVNAKATARHRQLLEAINNGTVSSFASGGMVGGSTPVFASAGAAAPIVVAPVITVEGGSRGPEADMQAAQMIATQIDRTVRAVVTEEFQKAKRPGNIGNNRGI